MSKYWPEDYVPNPGEPLPGLRFGLNDVWPDEAVAAWGARMIVKQDGYVDFVPDRQDAVGEERFREELLLRLRLNDSLYDIEANISWLLRTGQMSTRTEEFFELAWDAFGWEMTDFSFNLHIIANTNASAGYCYVTAFLVMVPDDSEMPPFDEEGQES